jgi:hypothetical protein
VVELGRLDAVDHSIQVVVRGSKAPEDIPHRVAIRPIRFRPASGELDTGDRVIATADTDAFDASFAAVVGLPVASVAALTSAHGASL